ncbi:acyl-CoA dehydrogenase [Thalassomonas sp. RHCl1]|uniref:acyl-CoA dehydrogenase n=1 Tax=Thalassomonas sp. RHCl1 TaxID=2995320 RepID=UPI00248B7F37|nr:acyl-CoA dehydrogenase [Thalassomonas sp. RHCl1]
MDFNNNYRVDLRDLNFLLWEQFDIENTLLDPSINAEYSKDFIQQLLFHARDFAYNELGANYQRADREGCKLLEDGTVQLPSKYPEIWQKYTDAQWGRLSSPPKYDGLGSPYMVAQMVYEIFQGADASFMVYPGFCSPAMHLIERFATEDVKQRFSQKLATNEWAACLCMTEPQAGSDVGAITTKAIPQEDGSYHIEGGKIFISGGMHDLTDNIVYMLLARVEGARGGTTGLSCFVVPRFEQQEGGTLTDNHVRCIRLEDKMGIHGCATAQLSFGDNGPCKAYLLGERENVGLRQLSTMMHMARISTGIYALGLAGRAYMNAAEYAAERIQGTSFKEAFNPKAEKVSIMAHVDVRRMLLEMKSKVEGCRALIHKLTFHQSWVTNLQTLQEMHPEKTEEYKAQSKHHESLVSLLTPIVKAYTSDQAWRVAELAIQVYGGHGYVKDHPVEQVARDVKILSIWEGTSFIQSADLMKDKLGMGLTSKLLSIYQEQVEASITRNRNAGVLLAETDALELSLASFIETHALMGRWVKERKVELIFSVSTRFLEMMAEVTLSWLLLDGAVIASKKLENLEDPQDEVFYQGKIASAQFYTNNILPGVKSKAEIIAKEDTSALEATEGIFLQRTDLYG